jgi:hypothetical protein
MKSSYFLVASFALAVAVGSFAADKPAAENRVKVTFESPEKFTDFTVTSFGSDSEKDLKYLTQLFTSHIESQAKSLLAPEEHLEITFKDIDLAGRFEPELGANFNDVRICREITYPRMVLVFKIMGPDGRVRLEGERRLSDMNYSLNLRIPTGDTEYRPDKDLLTDWMRSELRKKKS